MNKVKMPGIQPRIILYMAARNLWFKRFRSFLTILGVVIGIGSIFLLMSFGLGLQNLVEGEIIGSTSINTIDVSSVNSKLVKLDQSVTDRLRNIPNVKDVALTYTEAGKLKVSGATADAVVYGASKEYVDLSTLSTVAGRTINQAKPSELMINSSVLEAIGLKDFSKALNQEVELTVNIGKKEPLVGTFTIVGVLKSGSGSEVFVSPDFFAGTDLPYAQTKLVVSDRNTIPQVRQQVEALGLETSSPVDTLAQINQVFRFFNLILVGFGSIGMIIAVLGMLNTLTVSLLERTQEIALMIVHGGRPRDMQRLFIAEAVILSLIGGLVGIFSARLVAMIVDLVLNHLAQGRGVTNNFTVFVAPFWLVLAVLVFMLAVGMAVAFVPAKRASRINPIDALRHE